MNILVTGAAGFLGSHLVDRLLQEGHQVIALDNVSTGSWDNLAAHPRLLQESRDVEEGWQGTVDRIYHLACPASPVHYQKDPVKTLQTNYEGTRQMLELSRRCGSRLLLTSTSEVYGDPQVSPQVEGYWGYVNSFGPRSCYDEGKRVAESLCYGYHEKHGCECRIARIFNTYGPRMDPQDGRVVSNFVVQALTGQPLTLYGDGSQTRSLCYVDDLVEGLMRLMESSGPLAREPVNLGNPHEMTVREIASLVLELTGSSAPLEFRPLPQDDPRRRCPDIQRARERLGWEPRVSVRDGLAKTCKYFATRCSSSHHS